MPWHQLSLVATETQIPAVEAAFEALGALSITLGDAGDEPQLEPPLGTTPLWRETRLTALFPAEWDPVRLHRAATQALEGVRHGDLVIEHLEDRCWERAWLDAFHPMRFGRRLWVCPVGQEAPDPDAVVLTLDPGMAFGTGHHPTTAICLRWLDGADLRGRTLIDYGCGSGILALAALKLGAARAIAVDHDPQALQATADNAAKSGLAARIQICTPDTLPKVNADLVIANILAGPLIELAPRLIALTAPWGHLVLSGILVEQATAVEAAYQEAIVWEDTLVEEGWVRLAGTRSALETGHALPPLGTSHSLEP